MEHNRKSWESLNWCDKWKHGERDDLMASWKQKSKTCILVQFSTLPFNPPHNSDLWYVKHYSRRETNSCWPCPATVFPVSEVLWEAAV